MSRKISEFEKIRRRRALGVQELARLFGVTPRTVHNWSSKGAPPLVMRRLWELDGRLDSIHPAWAGFKIGVNGKLYGPGKLQFSPEYLKHWRQVLVCPCCGSFPPLDSHP